MSLDAGAGLALLLVTLEWLGLGRLSGLDWPGGERAPLGVRLALWLLVGALLVAVALLLQALARVPFRFIPGTLLVASGAALGLRFLARRTPGVDPPPALARPGGRGWPPLPSRLGWLALAAVLAGATLRSTLVPEAGWDAYSHWGLKAKAFFLAATIVDVPSAHSYYPPLVPLLEAWFYLHRGAAAIDQVKVIWALLGSAFIVCAAWHARLVLREPRVAPYVAAGILLGTTQLLESFWTGQADLILTAYLSLSVLALFEWTRAADLRHVPEQAHVLGDLAPKRATPSAAWLLIAALFAGGAALSKYEGLFRVALIASILLLEGLAARTSRWSALRAPAVYAGGAFLLSLPWTLFRNLRGIEVTGEHISALRVDAIGEVVRALLAVLGGVRTGGGWVVVVVGAATLGATLLRAPWRFLALVVLAQLGATFAAFLVTGSSPALQVQTSATRLLMQVQPLALFLLGVAAANVLSARGRVEARASSAQREVGPADRREVEGAPV